MGIAIANRKNRCDFGALSPCRTVFSVVSQTIAGTPPLLSVKMAYRKPKTGFGGEVSQKKLVPGPEDYRDIGGIA